MVVDWRNRYFFFNLEISHEIRRHIGSSTTQHYRDHNPDGWMRLRQEAL